MRELVFLLEEASAQALLQGLVPRFLDSSIRVRFIAFEGKQDLEKQLVRRMRSYLNPQARFLVLRDQDSAPDCTVVKRKLLGLCAAAGRHSVSLVRVACRELETIYLADLQAVEQALRTQGLVKMQGNARFRSPDRRIPCVCATSCCLCWVASRFGRTDEPWDGTVSRECSQKWSDRCGTCCFRVVVRDATCRTLCCAMTVVLRVAASCRSLCLARFRAGRLPAAHIAGRCAVRYCDGRIMATRNAMARSPI